MAGQEAMIARLMYVLTWLLTLSAAAMAQNDQGSLAQISPNESVGFRGSQIAEHPPLAIGDEYDHFGDYNVNAGQWNGSQNFCDESLMCQPRIWVSAEYVLWWVNGSDVPALLTTSDAGTLREFAARLNLPTTSTLFGGQELNDGARSGARFTLGGWLNLSAMVGFELNFAVLGNEDSNFNSSNDFEILGRPFFHLINDEQDAKLIRFPGVVDGTVEAGIKSEFFTGEALLLRRVADWGSRQVDWYIGYRHASLVDDLRVDETSINLSGPVAGSEIASTDRFRSDNTFHGVDFGVRVQTLVLPTLAVEMSGKVAVGTTRTETEIFGTLTATVGDASDTSGSGFLVQPTNTGVFEDDSFSTFSEFALTSKYMCHPGLSLVVGYNLLFWHDVSRAGERIDTTINTSQFSPGVLSGEPRPIGRDVRSNFWAHGLRFGFEYLF